MKKFYAALFAGLVLLSSSVAFATSNWYDIDLTDGTTAVKAIAAAVLVGLAIMWGIRKAIKTTNKS